MIIKTYEHQPGEVLDVEADLANPHYPMAMAVKKNEQVVRT